METEMGVGLFKMVSMGNKVLIEPKHGVIINTLNTFIWTPKDLQYRETTLKLVPLSSTLKTPVSHFPFTMFKCVLCTPLISDSRLFQVVEDDLEDPRRDVLALSDQLQLGQ